jgi:hypothetical protein
MIKWVRISASRMVIQIRLTLLGQMRNLFLVGGSVKDWEESSPTRQSRLAEMPTPWHKIIHRSACFQWRPILSRAPNLSTYPPVVLPPPNLIVHKPRFRKLFLMYGAGINRNPPAAMANANTDPPPLAHVAFLPTVDKNGSESVRCSFHQLRASWAINPHQVSRTTP